MSFFRLGALALVVVGGGVAALLWAGRRDEPRSGATAASASDRSPDAAGRDDGGSADVRLDAPLTPGAAARRLVPPDAWLIADFRGDLVGGLPFEDQEGLCSKVPAPSRVVFAVLPPGKGQEPDLLIAAQAVEDTFWGCARDRIVRAGGTALAQNDRYEVLKSPSGVVARGPTGSMVFLTSEAHLEGALTVLSDLAEGASSQGRHAALYARLHADRPGKPSMLDLTVAPPSDWLASVGQDASETPLRFVRSAFLGVNEDGSAQGGIECEEAGCADVLAFLERAKEDLLSSLPDDTAAAARQALRAEHVKGAGRITLTWLPERIPLGQLLGRFLRAGPLGP